MTAVYILTYGRDRDSPVLPVPQRHGHPSWMAPARLRLRERTRVVHALAGLRVCVCEVLLASACIMSFVAMECASYSDNARVVHAPAGLRECVCVCEVLLASACIMSFVAMECASYSDNAM